MERPEERLDKVTVKFAGDSGDGIQVMGDQFGNVTAVVGNDFATLPDFPAEIRAPQGTTFGVSSYQIQFAAYDIHTPGDNPDVLVAFNPAALKVNLPYLKPGGIIIVNEDEFTDQNLKKAGLTSNPLEDDSLSSYRTHKIPITKLTLEALKDDSIGHRDKLRCKNFLALGIILWLFSRPLDPVIGFLDRRFASKVDIKDANIKALKAGYNICDTMELFPVHYQIPPARLEPGVYRNINGALATAYGLITASDKSNLPLIYTGYPITPASEVLQLLSALKHHGAISIQTEDEISAITMAIGASYAGSLGVTGTSGPGLALKIEALNLAVMTELPLIVFDYQRSGISTGLPTKTEQGDLLFALFGRPSDSHVIILAPSSPSDCFWTSIEAVKLATKYMTPVVILSEQFLLHSSEPWKLPDIDSIPSITVNFRTDPEGYYPYIRDEKTLARPWVKPGTPELEHRIGGLEKSDIYGVVSYDPENHDYMTKTRAQKVQKVLQDIPDVEVSGHPEAEMLIVGWGSTYGHIRAVVERANSDGLKVARTHLRYLNPLPKNLDEVLRRYKKILVPELNLGQLNFVLRAKYLIDTTGYNRITGKPFDVGELLAFVKEEYKGLKTH
ncbi:MAG: 2-oxoacid:acceptor oxidoreductase subunit alpha [Deltaproteobacteria bacterium]|nr:2-oxoacid:acceptor oxidoreductase subunit alpha [Deltaproteobacteria bacterium]